MPPSSTGRSVAEVQSADRPDTGTSGRTTISAFFSEAILFSLQQRLCHGQSQIRRTQGPKSAGILQATAGGAQIWPVDRGFPASLQHPLYVPRQHGARSFFIKGSQHNQHPPLQW